MRDDAPVHPSPHCGNKTAKHQRHLSYDGWWFKRQITVSVTVSAADASSTSTLLSLLVSFFHFAVILAAFSCNSNDYLEHTNGTHPCINACVCSNAGVFINACVHASMHASMHVCMHQCMRMHQCMCLYAPVHARALMHVHVWNINPRVVNASMHVYMHQCLRMHQCMCMCATMHVSNINVCVGVHQCMCILQCIRMH